MGNTTGSNDVQFLAGSFTAAVAGFRKSYGALLGVTMLVALIMGPAQGVQMLGNGAAARVQAQSEAARVRMQAEKDASANSTPPPATSTTSAQDAASMLGDLAIWMGAICGSFIISLFLGYPMMASAVLLGAAVVTGRSTQGQYFRGFKRYVPMVLTLLLMVAGSIALLVPFSCLIALVVPLAMAMNKGPSPLADAITVIGILVVALPVYWVALRFCWALVRVADGARPNLGPIASYRASWRATAGSVQWRVLGTLLVMALAAMAALSPGIVLLTLSWQSPGSTMFYLGWAITGVIGIFVVYPWCFAFYGALYEMIMTSGGGEPPHAQVGLD